MAQAVVYIKIGEQTVAVLRGHVLDIQRYSKKKNLFYMETGQPVSISVAQSTLHAGRRASLLRVTDRDTGATYTLSRRDFDLHSRLAQNPGYEQQRAVPVSYWVFTPGSGINIPRPIEHEPTRPAVKQLGLFR